MQNLKMFLDVNGQRMQTGTTKTMIFGVTKLVSYVSQFMTLEPGDIITTGTPPGVGLGIKKDGKPVAALVDARLFGRIRQMQERFDALSQRLAQAYSAVPTDEGLAEIDAAVLAERQAVAPRDAG